eukprot:4154506-Amphidinium_carterae.1
MNLSNTVLVHRTRVATYCARKRMHPTPKKWRKSPPAHHHNQLVSCSSTRDNGGLWRGQEVYVNAQEEALSLSL